MYIRVTAALRLIGGLRVYNCGVDPLGLSVDPLGEVRSSYELFCKYLFTLLAKFGHIDQNSEHVDKTCVYLFCKSALGHQIYMILDDHVLTQKCQSQCSVSSNHYP